MFMYVSVILLLCFFHIHSTIELNNPENTEQLIQNIKSINKEPQKLSIVEQDVTINPSKLQCQTELYEKYFQFYPLNPGETALMSALRNAGQKDICQHLEPFFMVRMIIAAYYKFEATIVTMNPITGENLLDYAAKAKIPVPEDIITQLKLIMYYN